MARQIVINHSFEIALKSQVGKCWYSQEFALFAVSLGNQFFFGYNFKNIYNVPT